MAGRGSTGLGRPSPTPLSRYTPSPRETSGVDGTTVHFQGEDGRQTQFEVGELPLPGWHDALADAWSERLGPTGTLRTLSSARSSWGVLKRFIIFLSKTRWPPTTPTGLTAAHVVDFREARSERIGRVGAGLEVRSIGLIFDKAPLNRLVPSEVRELLHPRVVKSQHPGTSGYSDGELSRIVAAARADIDALRQRLANASADDDPFARLALETGKIPGRRRADRGGYTSRQIAEKVFATRRDLHPMLVLFVTLTGLNVEVIKELPSEYRIIDGAAVEIEIVKRRRGPRSWHRTEIWEIGREGQELRTPGGLYLLLHRLMSPARAFLPAPSFWAIWHDHGVKRSDTETETGERPCRNPFATNLAGSLDWRSWATSHDLRADPAPAASLDDQVGEPLRLSCHRLRTTILARRTRQLGGHLPSAARGNTTAVLFRNYLAGDQSTIEWARDVVSDAFADVERTAYETHLRTLERAGGRGTLHVLNTTSSTNPAPQVGDDATEGAWSTCQDHTHHPLTGRRCEASFLDCFHCSNAVIAPSHLPRLLSLLDALESRRTSLSDHDWWFRYGPVWAAIRHDVLPKFSEQEVSRARAERPSDSLLDLVEPRWEQP